MKPVFGIVGVIVGVGAGFALARLVEREPSKAEAAIAPCGAAEPRATLPPFQKSGDCSRDVEALTARSAELEKQLAFQQWVADSYRVAKSGSPMPWTDEYPEAMRPQAFEKEMRDVLEKCGAKATLVSVECQEAPCVASIRGEDDDWLHVTSCDAWSSRYGESAWVMSTSVKCANGSAERMGTISPGFEPWTESEEENVSKRLRERQEAVKETWTCAAP